MRREQGFTLMELLVVVAIIGILITIATPKFVSQISKSEQQAARAQLDALEKALEVYRIDVGVYPSISDGGLNALLSRPPSARNWRGPYLKKSLPKDPWGRDYDYSMPGKSADFRIVSLGKDGKLGGQGDDADISNEDL